MSQRRKQRGEAQLTYDSKKELFAKNVVSQYDLSTAENTLLTAKRSSHRPRHSG